MTAHLPHDIWSLIRSFSGDTCYGCTPTANLIHNITFRDDSRGQYMFDHGLDGYASTILINRRGYFRQPQITCSNAYCIICIPPNSSCARAKPHRWRPQVAMRIMHLSSNGEYILTLLDQSIDVEPDDEPEFLDSLQNHRAGVYIQDDILTSRP